MNWKYIFVPIILITQLVALIVLLGILELNDYIESANYLETTFYFTEKRIDIGEFGIFYFAKLWGHVRIDGVLYDAVINYPPPPVWASFSMLSGIQSWAEDFANGTTCLVDLDSLVFNRYTAITEQTKLAVTIITFGLGLIWCCAVVSMITGWIFYKKNKVIRMDNI